MDNSIKIDMDLTNEHRKIYNNSASFVCKDTRDKSQFFALDIVSLVDILEGMENIGDTHTLIFKSVDNEEEYTGLINRFKLLGHNMLAEDPYCTVFLYESLSIGTDKLHDLVIIHKNDFKLLGAYTTDDMIEHNVNIHRTPCEYSMFYSPGIANFILDNIDTSKIEDLSLGFRDVNLECLIQQSDSQIIDSQIIMNNLDLRNVYRIGEMVYASIYDVIEIRGNKFNRLETVENLVSWANVNNLYIDLHIENNESYKTKIDQIVGGDACSNIDTANIKLDIACDKGREQEYILSIHEFYRTVDTKNLELTFNIGDNVKIDYLWYYIGLFEIGKAIYHNKNSKGLPFLFRDQYSEDIESSKSVRSVRAHIKYLEIDVIDVNETLEFLDKHLTERCEESLIYRLLIRPYSGERVTDVYKLVINKLNCYNNKITREFSAKYGNSEILMSAREFGNIAGINYVHIVECEVNAHGNTAEQILDFFRDRYNYMNKHRCRENAYVTETEYDCECRNIESLTLKVNSDFNEDILESNTSLTDELKKVGVKQVKIVKEDKRDEE